MHYDFAVVFRTDGVFAQESGSFSFMHHADVAVTRIRWIPRRSPDGAEVVWAAGVAEHEDLFATNLTREQVL